MRRELGYVEVAFVKGAGKLKIPVEAWATYVPGIIVTSVPLTEPPDRTGYRVTHEKSGLALLTSTFPSIDIAILFAEEIKDLTDYNCEEEQISTVKELRNQIRAKADPFLVILENSPQSLLQRAVDLDREKASA